MKAGKIGAFIGVCVGGFAVGAIVISTIFLVLILGTSLFSKQGSNQYEGNGYSSAEEAAKAYVEAFNEKDYDKMLSTFAIETYVKNYSLEDGLDHMQSYMPTMTMRYPANNEMATSALVQARVGEVQRQIGYQYEHVSGIRENLENHEGKSFNSIGTIMLKEEASDFCEEIFVGTEDFDDTKIVVNRTLELSDILSSEYAVEQANTMNATMNEKYQKIYGADDIENVILSISADGKEYYLFTECVKYGNSWYITTFQSKEAGYLGLDYYDAGLVETGYLTK